MGDLHQWLEAIGLGQYADLFVANDIDRETLLLLGDEEFDRLGISLGHRKALLKAASAFRCADRAAPDRFDEFRGRARLADAKAERRHLTVLFCDIVGSTKLSARLDPEDLADVLRDFQGRCSDAIRHYDGYVARLMGDGVLAYFGFPAAHEDDAERAVNAALDMVASVSASPLCAAHGLKVRVGIATGLVIVGDLMGEGPAREFALAGEAPNLAARLQQRARPNQILVSSGTRRLLGSRFVLKDGGEHTLKGFERRVRVWQVLGPNTVESRFEARQASPLTRFVGRDRELALLRESYQAAERGDGRLVLISGEPGIGKSRLVMSLLERLTPEAGRVLSFQCSPYHTSSAWYSVIRYLEDAAGIDPVSPPPLNLHKLQALIGRHLPADSGELVAVLAALLNVPADDRHLRPRLTPQQLKMSTFAVLLALFRAHAGERPAILVFEDAHWIDPTSLELLERLRDDVQNRRMLVLVLYRPELTLPWTDRSHVAALTLNRLDRAQVAAMIEAVAAQEPLSRATMDQIVARTDGVPLFVEEMTKAVLETADNTTIDSAAGPGAVPSLPVPETLHDSLMARLEARPVGVHEDHRPDGGGHRPRVPARPAGNHREPDIGDALKSGREAVAHAEKLQHPHSMCYALSFLAGAHLLRRDADAVDQLVQRCAALAEEHGFTQWIAARQMLGGWARLERGDTRQALTEIRLSIETMEETGAQIWVQFARYLLASALLAAGETDEAITVADNELLKLTGTSGRWYEAELHRIKGNVLRGRGDLAAAETCYGTAITVAERQGALLWQLRAENDLASFRKAQGRSDEARARLASLYASLGHDIASKDVLATRALLDDMGRVGNGRGRRS